MSVDELRALLERVQDTREIVLRAGDTRHRADSELAEVWRAADGEARQALAAWRGQPGRERYAGYRAAAAPGAGPRAIDVRLPPPPCGWIPRAPDARV